MALSYFVQRFNDVTGREAVKATKSIRVEMTAAEKAELDSLCAAHGLTLSDAVRRGTRSFLFALQLAAEPRTPTGRPKRNGEGAVAA